MLSILNQDVPGSGAGEVRDLILDNDDLQRQEGDTVGLHSLGELELAGL